MAVVSLSYLALFYLVHDGVLIYIKLCGESLFKVHKHGLQLPKGLEPPLPDR